MPTLKQILTWRPADPAVENAILLGVLMVFLFAAFLWG